MTGEFWTDSTVRRSSGVRTDIIDGEGLRNRVKEFVRFENSGSVGGVHGKGNILVTRGWGESRGVLSSGGDSTGKVEREYV